MRTKEEITKKRIKPPEQLDLTSSLSSANKLIRKRRWLYFALFVTTGLSLFFWFYRSFKTIKLPGKLPQIKINLNSSAPKNLKISPQLSALLTQHQDIVSIYINHSHPFQDFTYGTPPDPDYASTRELLLSQDPILNAANAALLPPAVTYREKIVSLPDQTIQSSLITNPLDQIFITLRFHGSSDSLRSFSPDLIFAAYWMLSAN